MSAVMASSVPMTSLAMRTVSALWPRMKPMVSNQPARKLRNSSGFAAMILSVAKITWTMKSAIRSRKRRRILPSPIWTNFRPTAMLTMAASIDFVRGAAIREASSPIGTCTMPARPQPCWRDTSLTIQLVTEPTVDTPTLRSLRSPTVFTVSSARTISAKVSGGPAIAAMPLTGEPLAMKASPGPEPRPMSMPSAAIACWTRASPPKLEICRSRPCFLKMPVAAPISAGTNEKASRPALPTRSVAVPAALPTAAGHAAAAPPSRPRNARRLMHISQGPWEHGSEPWWTVDRGRLRLRLRDRQRGRRLDLLHRKARRHVLQRHRGDQLLVERVVARDVGHHDAQHVIDVASHAVELHHLGHRADRFGELVEPVLRMIASLDRHEHRDAEPDLLGRAQRHALDRK